jgi:prevent-host-death family protein
MKTNIVGLKELREDTEKYISQVKKGKSFTVVRRSKPIFKMTPVDEWGDEGTWETVADFRSLFPRGVSAERLLKALKAKNG